jgi:Holliday junction resolvasome RuvABC ATP-dependent DNA helicase subunit
MFDNLIGQSEIKRQLEFYSQAYQKTSVVPFLLLNGAKGLGKTEFLKQFSKSLTNEDGKPRPMLELNSSTIKNNQMFFEQIFMPIVQNNEVTLFFDECHALPKDLVMAFLSILNTERTPFKEFNWREFTFEFNFTKISMIFATTELDKLFAPLKDRMTILDFKPYKTDELSEIIKGRLEDVEFEDGVLEDIASTTRGNARSAVKRAKEIETYCETQNSNVFMKEEWNRLRQILGIKPLGLTNIEIQILDILKERGPSTLQTIAAVTGMSRTAIQKDAELYLLQKALMKIDGTREITRLGTEVLNEIKEKGF